MSRLHVEICRRTARETEKPLEDIADLVGKSVEQLKPNLDKKSMGIVSLVLEGDSVLYTQIRELGATVKAL